MRIKTEGPYQYPSSQFPEFPRSGAFDPEFKFGHIDTDMGMERNSLADEAFGRLSRGRASSYPFAKTGTRSASFAPSAPRNTYAFKGPLNYMDVAAGMPRGGRIPYSEYMAGARPSGATRSRAGYKKSAPKKRAYKKTTRLRPNLSVKAYGQARLKRGSKFTRTSYGKTRASATARQKSNRKKYGYTGRGMYSGGASVGNGLISGSASTMPRMRNLNDETGTLVVSHRERLSDVFAPADSGFHQDVFTVSPGIEKTFPWLSQIAANYEEYELMQCVFEYDGHSLVGINDTLEVQGSLCMATQMNVKDKAFRDRHEMERFPHASKCAQHGSMAHGVECDPRKITGDGHRYIRMGGLAKDEDARDFDHAKFTLGQYNTPTELFGKEIGQLFVFYTVKLIKPKISSGRGDAISTFRSFCSAPVSTRAFGRLANDTAQDAGNGMQVAARNSLPMTPTYDSSNDLVMTFDPYVSGTFRITATLKTSSEISGVSVVAGGSATVVKSQLPCTTGTVLFQASASEAVLIADIQVRPRDLASSSLASIRIDGLHSVDLVQSCLEITEINILEETSVTDQPELKLIA